MPEASSIPIFLRATMPQFHRRDTGEGGRFRVYLPELVQTAIVRSVSAPRVSAQSNGDYSRRTVVCFIEP
jgi:hypothetical protein